MAVSHGQTKQTNQNLKTKKKNHNKRPRFCFWSSSLWQRCCEECVGTCHNPNNVLLCYTNIVVCLLMIDYSGREKKSKIKLLTSWRIHYRKRRHEGSNKICNNTTTSKVASQSMWEHERLELIDEIIQNNNNNRTKPWN